VNAAEWIERHSGLKLRPWQVAAVLAMFPPDGSPSPYETFLLSTVKKAGKTSLNAWCVLYAALHFPAGETCYVLANDAAQAEENCFSLIEQAVRRAGLADSGAAIVNKDRIEFPEVGSRIVALPADFAGSAGGRFGVTSWTELWAYRHENHIRLWEEMTPNPNRRSLRIVDSYAGFTGDAPALEPLWERAIRGERLEGDLPIFTDGKLWAYVDQGEEAQERCWLGEPAEMVSYYEEQRKTLRPGTFNRIHLNQWQSSEEVFLTAEQWDACQIAEGRLRSTDGLVYVGLDAATKRDSTAVVAVAREGDRVRLVDHKIWTPRPGQPTDLEDVENYVVELGDQFKIGSVTYDPTQMERSAGILRKSGLTLEPLAQTSQNLTAASTALYDLVTQQRLALYPDKQMRQHVLNAVAVNSARGWKLAKEKSTRKIDAAVALSFACLAATRKPPEPGLPSSTRHHPWAGGSFADTPTEVRFRQSPVGAWFAEIGGPRPQVSPGPGEGIAPPPDRNYQPNRVVPKDP
jgi:phage terminase large subunit-like protein